MKRSRIYLDFATTTPLDMRVKRAMEPYWSKDFGNPSSLHAEGVATRSALVEARTRVARALQAHPDEVTFVASGTEANNLALKGYVDALAQKGVARSLMHLVISSIEHSSVRACAERMKSDGVSVSFLPVNARGIIRTEDIEKTIRPETVIVSTMLANNEIGTIQPIGRVAALLKRLNRSRKERPIRLHTDACQGALYLDVNQNRLGADLITLDGHKLYGPKGVGALYVRRGTVLTAELDGGGQERGVRSGTEAVPLIVGFAEALSLARERREKDSVRVSALRDHFFNRLLKAFPEAIINGDRTFRLANNVNISIPNLNAEFAVLQLDALGVACSAKSACLEHERASYVVEALGRKDRSERSALRFTLGRTTTKRDVDAAVSRLREVVDQQRKID